MSSRPGAVVLDACMGSGKTGIVCRELGREFIGIEKDPEWFAYASRWLAGAHAQATLFAP